MYIQTINKHHYYSSKISPNGRGNNGISHPNYQTLDELSLFFLLEEGIMGLAIQTTKLWMSYHYSFFFLNKSKR